MEYLELLQEAWKKVREQYSLGSCVSERGLQALLYAELRRSLPSATIVVEPRWSNAGSTYVPDLAIVEGMTVTDVFEIKFVPHHRAELKGDIDKLIRYGTELRQCLVEVEPLTGKWKETLATSDDLRRHFVVVANDGAAAVWLQSLQEEVPALSEHLSSFYHWFGRIGAADLASQKWDVQIGRYESM